MMERHFPVSRAVARYHAEQSDRNMDLFLDAAIRCARGYLLASFGHQISSADCEDLALEVAMKVLVPLESGRVTEGKEDGYVRRAAHRSGISWLRRSTVKHEKAFDLNATMIGTPLFATGSVNLEELAGGLLEIIATLPAEFRHAVVGYHLEGRTVEELAAEAGVSSALIYQRVSRGRRQLQGSLETRWLGRTAPCS